MARSILITGASGRIGTVLRHGLREKFGSLRLTDIVPLEPLPGEEFIQADLREFETCRRMMEGIDCVLHFGGMSREAPWSFVLEHGIAVSYNIFEAARVQRVSRVVQASSNHAVGFYPADQEIGPEDAPRPDSRYGVAKVTGEALGRLYADKYGLSVASLRIGSFRDAPGNERELATWLSPSDLLHLVSCCVAAPHFDYLTLFGVSANARCKWRNPDAKAIGYQPSDNAEAFAHTLTPDAQGGASLLRFHGGPYCLDEVATSR